MLASLGDNTDSHTNQRCRRVFLVTDSTRGHVASDEEGVGDCDADTIISAPRFALGGCCMPSSFSQWYGRGVLVVGSIITLNKKKPSWSPVNEATVRQLLEQEESEDEMSSAIDDTDSDPDYDPSGFRDQPHTPDLIVHFASPHRNMKTNIDQFLIPVSKDFLTPSDCAEERVISNAPQARAASSMRTARSLKLQFFRLLESTLSSSWQGRGRRSIGDVLPTASKNKERARNVWT
ncbi:hypothetical protein J6590_079621 [Homalodisca vitripennis]|nr:hypothetical protein J6590_079621 [Homalodisca vitripennis]